MAWFAVTSLMRTVELEFLSPNPRLVLEDTEAAEALHRRLYELVDFLEKSENQFNADDVQMRDWKARLKDVALRIEDEIESKVIDSYRGGQGTIPLAQSFHYTLKYAIEELTKFVKEELQMKGILSSRERIESSSSSSSSLQTASELQSTMVGRTAELERIKRLLLEDKSTETLVLSIVGMAGIGKTTFARNLYQDPLVTSHFDVLAWATVSTSATYDRRRILLELLLCIEPEWKKEFIHQINDTLPDLVRKRLVGQRYLIVLDDIWDINHWDKIKRSFPENCNESRILLTSRHDEVAMYARSYNYCSLNLPFLNSEESWLLFLQMVHARLPPQLEAIWRHIVNYFKGLPFAIVIAGGLARAINGSLWISKEMERIFYERMCSDLVQGISKILILSYNNLPNFLKICFLYLGVFPESNAIPVKKLIKLWIAEGFVKVESQRSLEEVAEDFLKDLVSRSLVLIDKISLDGKIKTCKVHDIVHDFCKRKAMEEGLLHVVDGHFGHLHTYRWVSIETMDISLNDISNRSRSILFFCHDDVNCFIDKITNFKMLRVLDLSSTLCFEWILLFTDVGVDLVLLRYLTLRIESPQRRKIMCELKDSFNLQTLVLLAKEERLVHRSPTKVHQIWRMPMLRHLQFSTVFMFDTPNVVQEYLQTIYWLRPSQCTKQVFFRIPNAKVMGIFIPKRVEELVSGPISSADKYSLAENWLDDLINLEKLEKLKINSHHEDPIILPRASAFPVQLRMLTLKGTLLPWDAMEVIGMLPNLEVLKLKFRACEGQHWKLSGGGFPKLKSLFIQRMKLEQWTATDNAFPILERIIIKHCIHLEKIPSTFDELYSLQLIELHGCHSMLVHSAKQIQQQQEELLGYNLLVVHAYNTQVFL